MNALTLGMVEIKLEKLVGEQDNSINKLTCRDEMQRTALKEYMHNQMHRRFLFG